MKLNILEKFPNDNIKAATYQLKKRKWKCKAMQIKAVILE